ncbi:MAG: hypothetical protein RLP44_16900 [Aggregatilineales bacterium]
MIEVSWYDKETEIVLWRFSGKWTEQEYENASLEHWALTMPDHEAVNVIVDLRQGFGPRNLIKLVISGFRSPRQNVNQVVVVGSAATWKSLYNMVTHMIGKQRIQLHFAENSNEAERILHEAVSV